MIASSAYPTTGIKSGTTSIGIIKYARATLIVAIVVNDTSVYLFDQ